MQNSPATLEAFSIWLSTDYRKLRTNNCFSARPAVLGLNGLEFFDFRAEADPAVSIRLVAHMDDARGAPHFLGRIPRHFRGHAKSCFDGNANLQGRRCAEQEAATRNVHSFCNILRLVRG